jgi:dolichol-phosphate mannosyltransferase
MPRRLLEALDAEGADVAVGSRYLGDDRAAGLAGYRAWISRFATWTTGLILRASLTDPMSGCFVMRREWYQAAKPRLSAIGFKILVDLVASSPQRAKVAERPTALRARLGGESKLDARVMADLVALLIEKWTNGKIPARFTLFAAVGASGVVVNLGLLWAAVRLAGESAYALAEAFAIVGSMAWNFALNNLLTFRDRRLQGMALVQGFIGFCFACSLGAVVNWGVAYGLHRVGVAWNVAGLAGAVAGGVFNFWAVRFTTWRKAKAA